MPEADRAQLSADWLSLLEACESADPWIIGFSMRESASGDPVGQCGFKGPPNQDGEVEIAYMVVPEKQGNGFATEAANALVEYAFSQSSVKCVLAHTLPEENASTRVLTKCQFQKLGEVIDPEDGPVWCWAIRHAPTS
ncbi:MAG: GNAT family N-acetyltransferase [Planctomycetota bacterium]